MMLEYLHRRLTVFQEEVFCEKGEKNCSFRFDIAHWDERISCSLWREEYRDRQQY